MLSGAEGIIFSKKFLLQQKKMYLCTEFGGKFTTKLGGKSTNIWITRN
jgi:hypothetical protein